jgi:hypothetical protein
MSLQGSLHIERMCQLAGVSKAGFYRYLRSRDLHEEEMCVRSLIVAHMASPFCPHPKSNIASVIACDNVDQIPLPEIGIAVSKGVRPAIVDNFRSFALEKLGRTRKSSAPMRVAG